MREEQKSSISVVFIEAGCCVTAVAACYFFLFFSILFYKWIFICFMLVDYGFRTKKKQQHIEKSSAMLFKMYTLCFILVFTSICFTHFENEYQSCTHTHKHTTLFDIFSLFCMIQTRNFKKTRTHTALVSFGF